MERLDDLRIRQLDGFLKQIKDAMPGPMPSRGWVKTIREALGMSIRQLAHRTGMSKTGVASAEAQEAVGRVQLSTLQRVADGLGCDVVHVLVPRTSLSEQIRAHATQKAESIIGQVSESMELEDQQVDNDTMARQVTRLTEDLLHDRGRDFWNA